VFANVEWFPRRVFNVLESSVQSEGKAVDLTACPLSILPHQGPLVTDTVTVGVAQSGRAILRLRDVCYSYRIRPDAPVLSGVSVEISRNTMVAFVGRSGSGKTTLCRLISGLYQPTSGSITIQHGEADEGDNNADYSARVRKQVRRNALK